MSKILPDSQKNKSQQSWNALRHVVTNKRLMLDLLLPFGALFNA